MDAPPSSAEVRVCVGRSGEGEAGNLPCVPAGGQQVVTSLTRTRLGLGGRTGRCRVPRAPPFILAAPRPCSQLNLMPKGPHPAKGQGPGPWSCLPVRGASWGSIHHPEAFLPMVTGAGAARGPVASVWAAPRSGTHPVKSRHSKVQKRMRTWLNMADCVRRMARWKSFCGTWHVTATARGPWSPGPCPRPACANVHVHSARRRAPPVPPWGWG